MTNRSFVNPTGTWSYSGPYQIHVVANACASDIDAAKRVGNNVRIHGTMIEVGPSHDQYGQIYQGGDDDASCYVGLQRLFFEKNHVIRISRPAGQLIWQNPDLKDITIQEVAQKLSGNWPKFYYDGTQIIGETSQAGKKYQLREGNELRLLRHGQFRFVKAFKTLAYLDVTIPRKGWNHAKVTKRIKIPTGKCLTMSRLDYHLEWMNTQLIQSHYFGYRPGHQPLLEYEIRQFLELLKPGPLMEERARKAFSAMKPADVRLQHKDLRLAAFNSEHLRTKVDRIKQTMGIQD